MKRVLIITYYWPPSGGGGVMRWLKMTKYLPGLGWKPIIYTPENPDASVIDESLCTEIHPETEIIKTPIWEPYELFRKLTGKKRGEKFKAGYISEASSGNWKNKLSVFIRGNFLIPDPRKFWIKPSVKFLSDYLKKNPVDLIISTGPPHSMHLIALGLKNKFEIPWIADFRDPWTDIDFYEKLRLTRWADNKHRKLEKKVLENADHIVTVSPHCAKDLSKIPGKKVEVINNGFDPEDFEGITTSPGREFFIAHFGTFNRDRNPAVLWKVLGKLAKEKDKFKNKLRIQLIGQTDDTVIQDIKRNGLGNNLIQTDHLPHKEGLEELAKSQILLLPINDAPNAKGILPGKMYEYMALRRHILAIGPADSDFSTILKETQSGVAIDFNDSKGIREILENYYNLFIEEKLHVHSSSVEKYSRKNLAKKFMELVDK
jgi:glycosyltransferase involved in cell wall biosynthesis